MPELFPPSLRADAQRNRERLLVAAADLFGARGLDVSMEDIAREAGVGVGTLYRRFGNREELIDALFESRLADFTEMMREIAEIPDAWTALVALLERMLDAQAQDRGLKHLFHSREQSHPAVKEVTDLVLDEIGRIVTRAQGAGQMRTDVQPMDVSLLAFQVGSVADLTAERDPDAWRRALAIALDGLRPGRERDEPRREPLPPGPIDRETFEEAVQCWRPPASPAD
jgi:AcrR family transcriptional regulator